jgi:hypothetical protein
MNRLIARKIKRLNHEEHEEHEEIKSSAQGDQENSTEFSAPLAVQALARQQLQAVTQAAAARNASWLAFVFFVVQS